MKTVHYYSEGNTVTDCLRPISAKTEKTREVLKVTCKACKKTLTFQAALDDQTRDLVWVESGK